MLFTTNAQDYGPLSVQKTATDDEVDVFTLPEHHMHNRYAHIVHSKLRKDDGHKLVYPMHVTLMPAP